MTNTYSELLKEIDLMLKGKNREIELQRFQIECLKKKVAELESAERKEETT